MRIMFMGTPDIAASCLKVLIESGESVVAVVTGADKPRGRGNVMTPTPVKRVAEENGIPVYTPKTLRDGEFDALLSEIAPDLIAVVAYGKILPPSVISYPRYGCLNLHVSLLPKYRGAAPMQRAIMNGETETGVTVMQMDDGLDTGAILSQVTFPILPDDDFETIHDESAEIGADLLVRTIRDVAMGNVHPTAQDDSLATYAAKIEKADCKVDFTESAPAVSCRIRGTTPIPGAFCYHNGKMLKLIAPTPTKGRGKPGEVISLDPKGEGSITVACGDGAISLRGVIPEGKGKMSAGDYIRGRKIALGDILE